MDVTTISILVVVVSGIVGLAEYVRLSKNDAATMAAQICTLETKIDHLEEKLEELKRDEAAVEAIVQKVVEEKIVNEKTLSVVQEKLKIQGLTNNTEK